MKRSELIGKLINEGLSTKTLSKLTDNQINILALRMLGEQATSSSTTPALNIPKNNKQAINTAMQNQQTFQTYENKEVVGKKKAEKVCDDCGKPISKCNCDQSHLEEKKGEKWIQKAIHPSKEGSLKKALGVKKDEKIPAAKLDAAAKKGGKLGQRARLAKTLKKLDETNGWVNNLVENEYFHNFTSKGEIMELIQSKVNTKKSVLPDFLSSKAINAATKQDQNEQSTAPTTKPKTPTVKPGTDKPSKPKHDPYNPGPKPSPPPKASASPTTKPKTPTVKPGTKTPSKPKHDPYNPGPKPSPAPKAMMEKEKKKA
jgi:hypothetical protein